MGTEPRLVEAILYGRDRRGRGMETVEGLGGRLTGQKSGRWIKCTRGSVVFRCMIQYTERGGGNNSICIV